MRNAFSARHQKVAPRLRGVVLGLGLAALFLWQGQSNAATYAVVTGVDDYPGRSKLASCLNDARAMHEFLVHDQNVPAANITLLLDADATAAGIEKAIKLRCKAAGKQDEVFFYFSGHGAIMPDWNGKGMVVKAMVPSGALPVPVKPANLLTQDRLKRALADTKASRVIVVLDCCHAGTWTRSTLSPTPAHRVKSVDLGWDAAEPAFCKAAPDLFKEFQRKDSAIRYTWLGACQSNQVSYCGERLSQFTDQFLAQLRKAPASRLADLFPIVSSSVEAGTKDNPSGPQTPQAEGSLDLPIVASSTGTSSPVVETPPLVDPVPVQPVASASPPPTDTAPSTERRDFSLKVELNKARYVKDDKLTITVTPEIDCYIRLYLINAKVELQQIFPNEFQRQNFLRSGQKVQVPPDQLGAFDFVMEGPWGVETIVAIASTNQFTDLEKPMFRDGLFQLGVETPGGVLTRGIGIRQREQPPVQPAPLPPPAPKVSITRMQYLVTETLQP